MKAKSSKKHNSPIGTFYCIGCDRHRKLSERNGRYGKKCKHCAEK